MRRARKAVDAAVFASAVSIDRAIKTDVWRIVVIQRAFSRIDRHSRVDGWQLGQRFPAIIDAFVDAGFKAAIDVGECAATFNRSG